MKIRKIKKSEIWFLYRTLTTEIYKKKGTAVSEKTRIKQEHANMSIIMRVISY